MKIRDHAKGRWPEIMSALVGPDYINTRKHSPCPTGEGKDCFRFSDKNQAGNFFCHCSNGEKDGFELLQCVKGWDFAEAAKQVEGVIGKCPKDGEEAKPKPPTRAERMRRETIKTNRSGHLSSRGLEVPPGLEWHKAVPYFDDSGKKIGVYPAMLAPIYRGDTFLTYHVTYLLDGQKAPLDPCRKIMPANGSLDGGACPLYPATGEHLGIAEGVESAIAAKMLFGVPVWAGLNTAILANWRPPEHVTSVTIYGDHDPNFAGHAAAYRLASRLAKKGIRVDVQIPGCAVSRHATGMDWNDWLLDRKEVA